MALLLAGFVLVTIGLRQYCSTEYYAGTTAISGSLEYLEKEKMRYAIRYNRGLKNDSLNYRVPGITNKAFDFVNFQKNIYPNDPVELLIKASDTDENQEIVGIA